MISPAVPHGQSPERVSVDVVIMRIAVPVRVASKKRRHLLRLGSAATDATDRHGGLCEGQGVAASVKEGLVRCINVV